LGIGEVNLTVSVSGIIRVLQLIIFTTENTEVTEKGKKEH